jgi:predicted dienelactone hydrolase
MRRREDDAMPAPLEACSPTPRTGAPRRWWPALLLVWLLPAPLLAQDDDAAQAGVGFAQIEVTDPIRGGPMPGYVFYPSPARAGSPTRVGPYEVEGVRDAPALPGARPLVLLSHGHAGSNLGHHDLATYLAGHGFVVAAIAHSGDDYRDASFDGHPEVLGGRPVQVSATIDALLRDPRWKPLIDADRIGVAGFSNGGYTSLLLVGAVPSLRRFVDYCRRYPGDRLCAGAKEVEAEAERQGQTPEQYMDAMQARLTHWGKTSDPRVKAAFAMAPLSLVFDADGLAGIDRPVFLYYSERDTVLRPSENAARIRPLLKTLVGVRTVPGADHWVFIPPCTRELAEAVAEICSVPPGVDRARTHARINADALAFFRKTLAPTADAAAATKSGQP